MIKEKDSIMITRILNGIGKRGRCIQPGSKLQMKSLCG